MVENHLIFLIKYIRHLPPSFRVSAPNFEAESFDPTQFELTRKCALRSLNLKGNTVGDGGVTWLALLLKNSGLQSLGLYQCGVGADGGSKLASCLREPSSILETLDLRENDLEKASADLASAAAASAVLSSLSGIDLAAVRTILDSAPGKEQAPVVLKAGKDAMTHGCLALLLTLRPYVMLSTSALEMASTPMANPLAHTATSRSNILEVELDFENCTMTGFYDERTEVLDELLFLFAAPKASVHLVPQPSFQSAGVSMDAELSRDIPETPSARIRSVKFDGANGPSSRQLHSLCAAAASNGHHVALFVAGVEFSSSSFRCVIQ